MKIIIIILISCTVCAAQNVPLTRSDSVFMAQRERALQREKEGPPDYGHKMSTRYRKVVTLDLQDVNNFINTLERLKKLEMYNPQATDKQKVDNYRSIEEYIINFRKRVIIDSVKIKD